MIKIAMGRKSFVAGVVLIAAGLAVFGWGWSEHKKEKHLRQEHQKQVKINLDRIDGMVGNDIAIEDFADVAPVDHYQAELDRYAAKKDKRELAMFLSVVSVAGGAAIWFWWSVVWIGRFAATCWCWFKGLIGKIVKARKHGEREHGGLTEIDHNSDEAKGEYKPAKKSERTGKEPEEADKEQDCKFNPWAERDKRIELLTLDSKSRASEKPSAAGESGKENVKPISELTKSAGQTATHKAVEESSEVKQHGKVHSEDFGKSVDEFMKMVEKVQQTALSHSEPLHKTLEELAKEVGAIRKYASQQQDRVEKLQEGYDWNIIRNFCLRIIRCIDNVEERIGRLSVEGAETSHLEDVKDELVFALESSGVEQFELEINSDYRGQERSAEAVKSKESCEDSNLKGKIAKVMRPGYQYNIDGENAKIVRTAQVKLFD